MLAGDMLARPFVRPLAARTSTARIRSQHRAPSVFLGGPKLLHLSWAEFLQTATAVCAATTSLCGLIISIRNVTRLTSWFKSQGQLVRERNDAIGSLKLMTDAAAVAHQAANDTKISVDTLRETLAETKSRLEPLEERLPVYDAAMRWTPQILEYVVWIENVAKISGFDLGGREMPSLPAIVVDYLKRLPTQP